MIFTGVRAQVKITGSVRDNTNEAIAGVTVVVKGTSKGVQTDANGKFSLTVPSEKSTVSVSYIGMQTQTFQPGKQRVFDIVLEDMENSLDEAVVVGYGRMKKRDLTGSVTNFKPDEREAAQVSNLSDMLQGKVAGLTVVASAAQPGAAQSMTIRGANSLRGDNQPLIVIDNVPQASIGEFGSVGDNNFSVATNPLTSLNPSDIESIEILKDASATAIYGSRGANGVILVTTKKGKSDTRPKVNITANWGINNASNLIDMMTLEDYAMYKNVQRGYTETQKVDDPQSGEWNSYYPFYLTKDGVYHYVEGATDDDGNVQWYRLNARNWQKEIYSTSLTQNYGVSVNGGKGAFTYFGSVGYKNMEGLIKGTGMQQGDARFNFGVQICPKVKLNLSLSGALKKNDMMAGGNTVGGSTGAISGVALSYAPYEMSDEEREYMERTTDSYNLATVWTWVEQFEDRTKEKTFRGSLNLTWDICPWLTYDLRGGGNITNQDRRRWYGIELYQGSIQHGYATLNDFDRSNYSIENVFSANKEWSDKLRLNATAGVTYDAYKSLSKVRVGSHFTDLTHRYNDIDRYANVIEDKQPSQNDHQILSFLARVNLSFLDSRYLLTASFRADGSSKFAKGNRWGYFPSATIAWRMEQEPWLQNSDVVSQLKLRLGYGRTGSQSIAAYSTISTYGSVMSDGSGTVYQGSDAYGNLLSSLGVTNLANSDLKWETTSSLNFGVDFAFWNSRISGSFDIYQKTTSDLLISKQMPTSAGFKYLIVNQGNLRNRGLEFTLNADLIRTEDWTWSLGGNISVNDPKIIDLGLPSEQWGVNDDGSARMLKAYMGNSLGDHFGQVNLFAEGYAPGVFYGYQTDGVIQKSDMDASNPDAYCNKVKSSIGTIAAGNWKFVDRNGDGVINELDKTIICNPNPKFTYGFQTSLRWQNLTFSMAFTGVAGKDIFNANARYYQFPSNSTSMVSRESFQNMWRDVNPWCGELTTEATMSSANSVTPKVAFDQYVDDGSYLRCSDITLAYDFPKSWMARIKSTGLNIYCSVKNAFTVTNYKGYDPEVNTFAFDGTRPGIDLSSYPNSRTVILGLTLGF